MRRILSLIVPLALFASACSQSSPAGPSAPFGASSSGPGATITGSVTGLAGGTAPAMPSGLRQPSAISSSIVVTVVGTEISASVNDQGRFTLTNVPGGTLQLQFNGAGLSGLLTIEDVAPGDTIDLSIQVSGSAMTLESERRSGGSEEQVEGRIEAFPDTPADGFVVAGRTIATDADTRFVSGSAPTSFDALAIGQRVHVKGQPSGAHLLARLVDIQNPNADLPVNVNGSVEGFSGTSSAFEFMVGNREVHGDSATEFFGGSEFADLENGARVEVKGLQRDGFVYASRIHVNDEDEDETEDDDDEDDAVHGAISAVSGTTAPLTLVVDGRTVHVTSATELEHRGDRLTFEVLQVGMVITASGEASGGAIAARKLVITGNAHDVDLEGLVVGPISGTCPEISFVVGSLALETTAFTEFKQSSCSALSPGANVKVRGVLLPDGLSAQVTRIELSKKP